VPRSRIEPHDVPISPSYGALKAATINYMAQLAQRWDRRASAPTPCRPARSWSRDASGTVCASGGERYSSVIATRTRWSGWAPHRRSRTWWPFSPAPRRAGWMANTLSWRWLHQARRIL